MLASGQQLTATNAGAVGGTSVSLTVTGIQSTFSVGQAVQNLGVPITSFGELQTTIGTATVDESKLTGEGWGRDAWGKLCMGCKLFCTSFWYRNDTYRWRRRCKH